MPQQLIRVAVPTPLRRLFDYLPPSDSRAEILPGMRVMIPFGRQKRVGVVVAKTGQTHVDVAKLKRAYEIIDNEPLLDPSDLAWLQWIADYYHHPIGEVLFTALPALLRAEHAPRASVEEIWKPCDVDAETVLTGCRRAHRQRELFELLQRHPGGLSSDSLNALAESWRAPMKSLLEKGWVEKIERPQAGATEAPEKFPSAPIALNETQTECANRISQSLGRFNVFVLEGVTGSGKTEVYLHAITETLARGEQALVLIPEIGLTPQLVTRFRQRLSVPLAIMHSGLNDRERLNAWLAARNNEARVIIGTRSALFTPLAKPGLIIVDEEHDASYKQQDGLRYSARDMAVTRAQRENIPIVLGSATPSLESLSNVEKSRYTRLHLPHRAGSAQAPVIKLIDTRAQPLRENISEKLIAEIRARLQRDEQVLLFLNRRGYAPTLLCHDCGWSAECQRCNSHMTVHRSSNRLRCHHCGSERALPKQCPSCSALDLVPLGYGTERTETFLSTIFPEAEVIRIDRDSTRRKHAMSALIEKIREGKRQILLGTQMLAKGHNFPNVTLVGILNADQGLYSVDLRAMEHLAQLITQVAGRAGRGDKPGHVYIQTHHPDHPQLQLLIREGYPAFARQLLEERRQTGMPPYAYSAMLRAEATKLNVALDLLRRAKQCMEEQNLSDVTLLGPVPAPMEKKAGRFRAQLLLLSPQRKPLHQCLSHVALYLEQERKARWSIDVDPVEMS